MDILIFLILSSLELINSKCCYGTKLEFFLNGTLETCHKYNGWFVNETPIGHRCRSIVCGNGKAMERFHCGLQTCSSDGCNCTNGCIYGNALNAFTILHGDRVRKPIEIPIRNRFKGEQFCCTMISKYFNMQQQFEVICDCTENCLNLPAQWQTMLATVKISSANDIEFFADDDCNDKTVQFVGDDGNECAIDNYQNGIGCSKILNGDTGSIRIISRRGKTAKTSVSKSTWHSFLSIGDIIAILLILVLCCFIPRLIRILVVAWKNKNQIN